MKRMFHDFGTSVTHKQWAGAVNIFAFANYGDQPCEAEIGGLLFLTGAKLVKQTHLRETPDEGVRIKGRIQFTNTLNL